MYKRIAKISEIKPGEMSLLDLDGFYIILVNVYDEYYAIEDICSHDGGTLADGKLIGYEIECPRHGARFDIRNGRALCMPAIKPIKSFLIKKMDNELFIYTDDL